MAIKIKLLYTCYEFIKIYRLPTIPDLHGFLKDVGFSLGPTVVLTDLFFQEEHWLDKEGPFRQEWRNTDRYTIAKN